MKSKDSRVDQIKIIWKGKNGQLDPLKCWASGPDKIF